MLPGSLRDAVEGRAPEAQRGASTRGDIGVCHIVSGDRWAGAEVQVATLLRQLSGEHGIRLSAIVLNEGRLAREIGRFGIELKVIPEQEKSFLEIVKEGMGFLKGRGTDILHSHRYKENLLAAVWARRASVPFVVRTQHGLPEPLDPHKRLKQGFLKMVDGAVARWATDRVISVSSEMTRHLVRRFGAGKIVTIPNGVSPQDVQSRLTVSEAKSRLGVPADAWVLGYAGRLEPIKRLDIFLHTAKQVLRQMSPVRFVIAGEGSDEPRLRALARQLELTEHVQFLNHRDDIYDVLRAFDVLLLCSDHEGLPMILLEAFCLGVPVVGRQVGGIPDVVRHDVNGIVVNTAEPADLAEACIWLLREGRVRQRLAEEASRTVAESFPAQKTASQVAGLYRALVRTR